MALPSLSSIGSEIQHLTGSGIVAKGIHPKLILLGTTLKNLGDQISPKMTPTGQAMSIESGTELIAYLIPLRKNC